MHAVSPLPTLWDGYAVIELPFGAIPPRELTRGQARQFFTAMMDMREKRIAELRGLVSRNGYPTESEADFRRSVVEFINSHVEAEETPIDIGFDLGPDAPHLPLAIWQAVGLDVGLLLGSAVVADEPNLHWELLTRGGKWMDGYHFPVIRGFEHGDFPDYYMSPLTLAQQLVGGAADGRPMEPIDYWVDLFHEAA